jgi:hypothetical protein
MWLKLLKRYEEVWTAISSKALAVTPNLRRKTIRIMMTGKRSITLTAQFLINCKVLVAKKSKQTLGLIWWSLSVKVILVRSEAKIIEQINPQTQDLTLTTSTQGHQSSLKHRLRMFSLATATRRRRLTLEGCRILWIFSVSSLPRHQ